MCRKTKIDISGQNVISMADIKNLIGSFTIIKASKILTFQLPKIKNFSP